MDTLDKLEFESFLDLLTANYRSSRNIIRTALMEELVEVTEVETPEQNVVWINGPPGSGKTTTLYWLYKQCKDVTVWLFQFIV